MHFSRQLWRADFDRLLPRLMGCFVLGCVLGSLTGLLWPEGLFRFSGWTAWLEGQRVPYGRLLLRALRVPALLCLCACARTGRRTVPVVLCLCGAALSYAVTCLILWKGVVGLLMAIQALLFHGLLLVPTWFYLSLCCCAQRRPLPLDGAVLRRLLLLLLLCAVLTVAEYLLTPIVLSFWLWISG